MKLSLYAIIHNLVDDFKNILKNVSDYDSSNLNDEFEFIVLDVSSDSYTRKNIKNLLIEASKKWSKKITYKYYEYKEDPGIYIMRLDAVNYCTGDYIACVDNDDCFIHNAFERIINIINEDNSQHDIYEFSTKNIWGNTENCDSFVIPPHYAIKKYNLSVLEDGPICYRFFLWTHVIRSSIYKHAISKLPRITSTFGEDVIILFMVFKESKSYYGIDEILHIRHCREESDSFCKWLKRDFNDVSSEYFTNFIYNVIDSDNIFKNEIIKTNVRRYIIGRLRENDFVFIDENKYNNELKYKSLFDSIYGTGAFDIRSSLTFENLEKQYVNLHSIIDTYARQLCYTYLLDKYGYNFG